MFIIYSMLGFLGAGLLAAMILFLSGSLRGKDSKKEDDETWSFKSHVKPECISYLKQIAWIVLAAVIALVILFICLASIPAGKANLQTEAAQVPSPWLTEPVEQSKEIPKIIWIFWNQPREERPELVKYCEDRIRAVHGADWTVNYLSDANVLDFVEKPMWDWLMERKNDPQRFFPNLIDYLRLYLLKKYGGVWVDASMFLLKSLDWIHDVPARGQTTGCPEMISYWNGFVFSPRYPEPWTPQESKFPRWTETWFIAAPKASPIICEWLSMLHIAFTYKSTADFLIGENIKTDVRTATDIDYFIAYLSCSIVLDQERGNTTRDIAYLSSDIDGYRYKNYVQTTDTWDWQMDIHYTKCMENLLSHPESVICPGARMIKFDKDMRRLIQADPKSQQRFKKLIRDFSDREAPGKPSYLEITRTVEGAPARDQLSKPFSKFNFKVWRLDSLVRDKKWVLKHALRFAIGGLVLVVLLIAAFIVYRLCRPVEKRLEHNRYVIGTAIFQSLLFVTSFVVGLCQQRTATQGGQIVILMYYTTDANILMTLWLPFAIMALVYGFQSDALKAGTCLFTHLIGTCVLYCTGPSKVYRLFFQAWDSYVVFLTATMYILLFVFTRRVYRTVPVKRGEGKV